MVDPGKALRMVWMILRDGALLLQGEKQKGYRQLLSQRR